MPRENALDRRLRTTQILVRVRESDEIWVKVCDHLEPRRRRGWWFDDDRRGWCLGPKNEPRLVIRQVEELIVEIYDTERSEGFASDEVDSLASALPGFERRVSQSDDYGLLGNERGVAA